MRNSISQIRRLAAGIAFASVCSATPVASEDIVSQSLDAFSWDQISNFLPSAEAQPITISEQQFSEVVVTCDSCIELVFQIGKLPIPRSNLEEIYGADIFEVGLATCKGQEKECEATSISFESFEGAAHQFSREDSFLFQAGFLVTDEVLATVSSEAKTSDLARKNAQSLLDFLLSQLLNGSR